MHGWNFWHFWKEIDHFTSNTSPFPCHTCWFKDDDVIEGRLHIWHEMNSLLFTQVLEFVGCQTTSKQLGIESAECLWMNVKMMKDGKKSLNGKSLDKKVNPEEDAQMMVMMGTLYLEKMIKVSKIFVFCLYHVSNLFIHLFYWQVWSWLGSMGVWYLVT